LPELGAHKHISFPELVELKIPALSGRGAKNNKLILKTIALSGPLLKYDIFKDAQIDRYSTISRRVDGLIKKECLEEANQRITKRGKKKVESMYGLTWRGFITSLTIKEVRENIIQVLKRNPLLTFPEKEIVLPILEELVTQNELETIATTVLEAFLKTIPNLELIEIEPMSIFAWLLSSIKEFKFPDDFKLSRIQDEEELLKLLDKPAILQAVKEKLVPLVKQKTMETKAMYQMFLVLNQVGEFISKLQVEDQPSEKIREYYENELKAKLESFFGGRLMTKKSNF